MFNCLFEMLFAVLVCALVEYAISFARARATFPLIVLKSKFQYDTATTTRLVLIGLIACCLIVLPTDRWIIKTLGVAIAAFLIYRQLFPRLQFREHGIYCGQSFIPWNSISKFSWQPHDEHYEILTIRGPWLLPRHFAIEASQRHVANGAISGAARLERTPRIRLIAITLMRCFTWGLSAAAICILLCPRNI